jgi:hypothetical protein
MLELRNRIHLLFGAIWRSRARQSPGCRALLALFATAQAAWHVRGGSDLRVVGDSSLSETLLLRSPALRMAWYVSVNPACCCLQFPAQSYKNAGRNNASNRAVYVHGHCVGHTSTRPATAVVAKHPLAVSTILDRPKLPAVSSATMSQHASQVGMKGRVCPPDN